MKAYFVGTTNASFPIQILRHLQHRKISHKFILSPVLFFHAQTVILTAYRRYLLVVERSV